MSQIMYCSTCIILMINDLKFFIHFLFKDPFLCNACGFCKYAKFEYTLTSRPCCAVDPIENEDDRKKAILSINSLLDKADRVYRQLIGNKPILESLLLKVIY